MQLKNVVIFSILFLFMNSVAIAEMVKKHCPDNHVVDIDYNLNGSIPMQGIEDDFYFYIFVVQQLDLQYFLQKSCAR